MASKKLFTDLATGERLSVLQSLLEQCESSGWTQLSEGVLCVAIHFRPDWVGLALILLVVAQIVVLW